MIDFKPILDKKPNIVGKPEELAEEFYNLYPENEAIYEFLKKYNFNDLFKRGINQKLISEDDFNISLTNYNRLTSLIGDDANELFEANNTINGVGLCRGIFYLLLVAKGYSVFVEDDKYYLSLPLVKPGNKKDIATKNSDESSSSDQFIVHTHNNKTYVVSPTCQTQKHKIHICQICGKSFTDSFDMEGDHVYEVVDYVAPKCNRKGYLIKKCVLCGHEDKFEFYPTPHNYTDWVEKEYPTCTTDGLKVRECVDCGYVEESKVKALGHVFSKWTEKGNFKTRVCKNCGEKETVDLIKEKQEKQAEKEKEEKEQKKVYESDKNKLFVPIIIASLMFIAGAILLIIDGIRIYYNGIIHNYALTAYGYGLIIIPTIYCLFPFERMSHIYKKRVVVAEDFRCIICMFLGILGFCLFFNNFFNMIVLKKNFDLLNNGEMPKIITILLRSAPIVLILLGEIICWIYMLEDITFPTYLIIFFVNIAMLILLIVFAIINHLFGSWLFWGGVIACLLNGVLTFFNDIDQMLEFFEDMFFF